MSKFIDYVIKKNKCVLLIGILLALTMGYMHSKLEFNNNFETFFDENDPDLETYKNFQKDFGNEEYCLIVLIDENLFSNKGIEIIRKISEMAKNTEGVQRVFSITEKEEAIPNTDTLTFKKIIPEGHLDMQALSSAKRNVLNNEFCAKKFPLISNDAKIAGIMIELEAEEESNNRNALLSKIKESTKKIANNRVKLMFSGFPYYKAEIDRYTLKDLMTLMPISSLIIFMVTLFMLKNMSLSISAFIGIGVTLLLSSGLFILCGEKMNMVTQVMPAALIGIAVAAAIHLLSHYKDEFLFNGKDHITAIGSATRAIWFPCLFTSLTTAVGFFSFVTSNIRVTRALGIFTAAGVMIAFIVTVTFLPATLVLLKKRMEKLKIANQKKQRVLSANKNKDNLFEEALIMLGNFSTTHKKLVIIVSVFITIISIIGMSKINFKGDFRGYLPADSTIVTDLTFINKNLSGGGMASSELIIKAKSEEFDFTHPESLKMIEDIQNDLTKNIKSRHNYHSVPFSIVDYFKEINMSFHDGKKEYYKIPKDRIDILDYYEMSSEEDLQRLISWDKMEVRLSFQFRGGPPDDKKEPGVRIDHTAEYLNKTLGKNFTYIYTGMDSLTGIMEKNLKKSLLNSFLFAYIIIFFMMFWACKNFKLAFISMVPNLFPIAFTIGLMGWLGIPFDITTIMIASVVLGIAVDDTIHYVVWFKRSISSGMDTKSSLLKAYGIVGKPIVITTIVLVLCFLTISFASMVPLQRFGLFAAIAIFAALISDLILLPALILTFKPKLKNKAYQLQQKPLTFEAR